MRFSLKWLLAGMAYLALAAAATAGSQRVSQALWLVTIGICLSALVTCLATRWSNAFCAGFIAFAAVYLHVLTVAPTWLPSNIAIDTFDGYLITDEGALVIRSTPGGNYVPNDGLRHAVTATANMLAGLIGGALVTLACRRHGQRE